MELKQTAGMFQNLKTRPFSEDDPISMGALVELTADEEVRLYFIGPKGGGAQVVFEDKTVMIITVGSPLGRALLNQELDDEVSIGAGKVFEITGIY